MCFIGWLGEVFARYICYLGWCLKQWPFYIWRVQRWWRISCLFVMSGIESLRVSQRGSHLDTVDTFTPGLRLSLPTMIHCIEAGIEKYLPLYQWNWWNGSLTLGFFDIFAEVSSLEVVSFWELQWVQTPVSCSGSDGAFMKKCAMTLMVQCDPRIRGRNNSLSGETTLTLWKVK